MPPFTEEVKRSCRLHPSIPTIFLRTALIQNMNYSTDFRLMAQEGHLASNALLSGFEAINRMDYDKPGTIYSALFQLVTGFERIMKIVVILNHKTQHELRNPTEAQMREFGHSIDKLNAHCKDIDRQRGFSINSFDEGTTLQAEIINFLTKFASRTRYYNLNQLLSDSENVDPLSQWFAIHFRIAEHHLSYKRRDAVMSRARTHCDRNNLFGWEMGPMGRYDLTVNVTFQHEVARLSKGHCVWALIEILKPIYHLIDCLTDEVHEIEQKQQLGNLTVPHMTDFFPFYLTTKDTAVKRKAWTSLFHIAGRV